MRFATVISLRKLLESPRKSFSVIILEVLIKQSHCHICPGMTFVWKFLLSKRSSVRVQKVVRRTNIVVCRQQPFQKTWNLRVDRDRKDNLEKPQWRELKIVTFRWSDLRRYISFCFPSCKQTGIPRYQAAGFWMIGGDSLSLCHFHGHWLKRSRQESVIFYHSWKGAEKENLFSASWAISFCEHCMMAYCLCRASFTIVRFY